MSNSKSYKGIKFPLYFSILGLALHLALIIPSINEGDVIAVLAQLLFSIFWFILVFLGVREIQQPKFIINDDAICARGFFSKQKKFYYSSSTLKISKNSFHLHDGQSSFKYRKSMANARLWDAMSSELNNLKENFREFHG